MRKRVSLKSPVRENCTLVSVRGRLGNWPSYRDGVKYEEVSKMLTQKVMVTGGTWSVGSHTVAELLRNGYQVRLLARNLERSRESLSPPGIKDFEAVLEHWLQVKGRMRLSN